MYKLFDIFLILFIYKILRFIFISLEFDVNSCPKHNSSFKGNQ